MADANELLRRLRLTVAQLQVDEDEGVRRAHIREVSEHLDALDAHLRSGGTPPTAWVEGPDEPQMDDLPIQWQDGPERHDPRPEGFGIVAHWSTVHEGVNVEMDVPDGLRVTVHYNEWLAVDSTAGVDVNLGEPLLARDAQRVLDALPNRASQSTRAIAANAGLTLPEVRRALPALEMAGHAEWTGTGWRKAPQKAASDV